MDIERAIPRAAEWMYLTIDDNPIRAVVATIAIGMLLVLVWTYIRPWFRRGKMANQTSVDQMVADAVLDSIDKLFLDGKITAKQRKRELGKYSRFLSDLKPRKRKLTKGRIEWLKSQIKWRTSMGLPGPKKAVPGAPTPAKGRVKGHWFKSDTVKRAV